jgi:hypothetical protein
MLKNDARTEDEIRASVEELQKEFQTCQSDLDSIDLTCRNHGHDVGGKLNANLAEKYARLVENLEELRAFKARGWYRRALEMFMLDFPYDLPPERIHDASQLERWVASLGNYGIPIKDETSLKSVA